MSFARYPAYKDSGVEWLGEVPVHWEVRRLKHNLRLLTEKTDRRTNPVALENIDSWSGRFVPTETEFQGEGVAFEPGDILFGKLRPYLAKALLATQAGEAVGDFHVMRPGTHILPRFAQYSILNRSFIDIVDGSTFGSKMPRASWEFVGVMPLPTPPRPEQTAIATFLDHETAKIDALVAEQERLIALLQEKRQAVISHAVTKGLDPSVPMKDSGVAWLRDVPAHWTRKTIKFALRALIDTEHKTAPFFDDGEYLVVRTSNVKNGLLVLDGAKYTDREGFFEWTKRGAPQPGDIIFTREAPAGEACVVPAGVDLCLGQRTVLFQVDHEQLDAQFAVWSVYAGLASEFIANLSQGSTVPHFNMSDHCCPVKS